MKENVHKLPPTKDPHAPLTLSEWLKHAFPEPDFLLGELISTTSRLLIVGPTGLGKTMFGLAIAFAIILGVGFLHWPAGRRGRVLYIDGEMSARLMRRRLLDALRRSGADEDDDALIVLSRENFPDMPPLNTKQGQQWLDDFIEMYGPFDLIIFDNLQALIEGSMKEEEPWAAILAYVRSLTARSIGQVWFHHTGIDESRSYGSKAKEWQMDTVALMERVKDSTADLAFTLTFTKARERNPGNRTDFEPVTMQLAGDQWEHGASTQQAKKLRPNASTMLRLLIEAMPDGLTVDEWNAKARAEDIGVRRRATLSDIRADLKGRKLVHECAGRWFVT